ncbi:Mov34/MPN/PAD-1 family protein [Euzebya tangerina]|uniref:Mov34/MPN/PAD-1 family protein n=1 Tax=Euzebya tangerina TaxID=591198 RepID=UPI000E322F35|nr:M67 family metallopeptidase [Euzebya tangerina]
MSGRLDLPGDIRDEMLIHARSDVPYETCGLLASDADGNLAGHWPVANADRSMTWFRMDPKDQLRAMRAMDDAELEWSGIWHCHTHTEPFPSPTDIDQSVHWPGIVAVIVSLQDPDPVIRAFDIADGEVTERVLTVDGKEQDRGAV